nr:hypothetical protein [Tanacetum cinerariifolium]
EMGWDTWDREHEHMVLLGECFGTVLDRREVVSKVVPYDAMKLVYSDDMGSLVGRLVPSAILYGRCRAYEQKPPYLQRPAPSRTQDPLPSSQKATSSLVPVSNPMSPPVDVSVVKP